MMKFQLKSLIWFAIVAGTLARPTFDKIADVLLDLVDYPAQSQYSRPYGPSPPRSPNGPLIQEGYDHGYDYYYGGGSGGGSYHHRQPPTVTGYYPPSSMHAPVRYAPQRPPPSYPPQFPYGAQASYPQAGNYGGSYGGYQESTYGGSYGGYQANGYKTHGY